MKYFIAVVEERNFTKAAEKLFIAQPPLSRAIQNLEEELEVSLLIRNTRSLELTDAGQYFYENAKKIVQSEIELKNKTRQIDGSIKTIKIGYVSTAIYGEFSYCIKSFRKSYPDIAIELVQINTLEQMDALKSGKIDVGFGRLKIIDQDVERVILKEERLYVAFSNDHEKLSKAGSEISLKDIANEDLIVFPDTPKPNFYSSIIDIFAVQMLSLDNILPPVRGAHTALGMVMAGLGISIVSEAMVNHNHQILKFIPIKESFAVTPIILSYRKGETYSIINEFIALTQKSYSQAN